MFNCINMAQGLYVWGKSSSGQLALGGVQEDFVTLPKQAPFYDGFTNVIKQIYCGNAHTVFLTHDGIVYTCGNNDFGQLGHNKGIEKPERIESLETFTITKVACGQDFTVVLTDKGKLLSWGNNRSGQLGHTNQDIIHRPKTIKYFANHTVVQISCGVEHTMALTNDGQLFTWGSNSHGQLGIGNTVSKIGSVYRVTTIAGLPIINIATGGYHSMVLGYSGALFTWGRNSFGQLGINDSKDQFSPVHIIVLRSQKVCYISCGEHHTAVLTEDGGVFTFGAGADGQLGHNTNANQNQPRKVMELMGTVITQISCGRRHTLAYAPLSGRIYSFGLGACGQLGIGHTTSYNCPTIVKGPWLTASPLPATDGGTRSVVFKLFSGGDHCLALIRPFNNLGIQCDMRQKPASFCCVINTELVDEIEGRIVENNVTVDIQRLIEMVFSNQQCLNGSFFNIKKQLLTDTWIHAVDLSAARKFFQALSKNDTLNGRVLDKVERVLMPSLTTTAIDLDCLRVYVILPEYLMFRQPERYKTMAIPFAKKLLALQLDNQKILGNWWSTLPPTFFQGIIKTYQDCVTYILKEPMLKTDKTEFTVRETCLKASLEILDGLYKVNSFAENPVPYTIFYISELTNSIELSADYIRWLQSEIRPGTQDKDSALSFCKYPFVFDAKAKYTLLQTDANLQMQSAFQDAHSTNIGNMLINGVLNEVISPFLVLHIRRSDIVKDTLAQVVKLGPMDYKKPLQVVFEGEKGVDAGGVKKEFFLLLMKEILDPKFGMFKIVEENNLVWFNKHSFEENAMFLLIGVICGLAIYNSIIIDLPFPPLLYNKLLKRPVTLEDFRTFQPSVARSLQTLLDYTGSDVEDVFGLNFQVTEEYYGMVSSENLIENGDHIVVTADNRSQYVELYLDYVVNKSIEKQFEAFFTGFHRVCGGKVLQFFHPLELMEMVVGIQEYDFNELEKGAEYHGEYFRQHPVIERFWQVFYEFDMAYKKKFLMFLTGTDRVPLTGIRNLHIKIQPVSGGENDDQLPVAHTCFNLLDLPRYASKEIMRKKLKQAIDFVSGFDLA